MDLLALQRYALPAMQRIWSRERERVLWRKVWLAMARALWTRGVFSDEEVASIHTMAEKVDLATSDKIEERTHHELVAELELFRQQTGVDKIHLASTSSDVVDRVDMMRIVESLDLVDEQASAAVHALTERAYACAGDAALGFTHLQEAEVTTIGKRLAMHAEQLRAAVSMLRSTKSQLRSKRWSGAVGTGTALYLVLRAKTSTDEEARAEVERVQDDVRRELGGVEESDACGQTYHRIYDFQVAASLAAVAAAVHKTALDMRLMQSPLAGFFHERRDADQICSSAMPHKANPQEAETTCGICRMVESCLSPMWSNAAQSMLERTLDDSSVRRVLLPQAFALTHSACYRLWSLICHAQIDKEAAHADVMANARFQSSLASLHRETEDLVVVASKYVGDSLRRSLERWLP